MSLSRKRILMAIVPVLVGSVALSMLAYAEDPLEPGPGLVQADVDYWGSYKKAGAGVGLNRSPGQEPKALRVTLDSDRTPPDEGLRNEWAVTVLGTELLSGYSDVWRDDAPAVFKALDKICPALKNAC